MNEEPDIAELVMAGIGIAGLFFALWLVLSWISDIDKRLTAVENRPPIAGSRQP